MNTIVRFARTLLVLSAFAALAAGCDVGPDSCQDDDCDEGDNLTGTIQVNKSCEATGGRWDVGTQQCVPKCLDDRGCSQSAYV